MTTIFHSASGFFSCHRALRYWPLAMIVFFLVVLYSLVLADDRILRVARISLIEGEVSYQRANDSKKDWFDATLNLPLDESDQLYSGPDGRAEIQLSGRNIVRIDHNTNLRFTQFNTGTIQLALPVGTATFRIDSLDRRQFQVVDANDLNADDAVYFEVDTTVVAITFLKEGSYRVNVRDDGTTEIIVRRGQAEAYNQELGTITIKQGRRLVIDGKDANNFQITRLEDKDNWDRWNDRRDDDLSARVDGSRSGRYVPVAVPGVYDLDSHGEWFETPEYGWVWAPRATVADWAPYRQGYWRWYPAYGWTWISNEPWGWVPYHYGRWAYWRSRWCWVPSVVFGTGWSWSPHLVVFFGWDGSNYRQGYRDGLRDGYRAGFRDGRGWLGWCPLGPGDPYYGHRTVINNTTIINNYPRSVESLRNYSVPGGVSRIESRRFIEGHVNVTNGVLINPSRGSSRTENPTPVVVRADEIKPMRTPPIRTTLVDRAEVSRKLEAPVVVRRTASGPGTPGSPTNPARSLDESSRGSKVVRDGVVLPSEGDQDQPVRNGRPATSPPGRVSDGIIQRSDRPPRYTDYKQVERVNPPAKRPEDGNSRGDGQSDSPRGAEPPRENAAPGRSVDHSSSGDSGTRRVEPPRPPGENREGPRESRRPEPPPRESAPPRNVERSSSPPPRESAPPHNVERPSSPPPPRESAPPRNTERPSSPPPRESAPPRNTERPSSPPPRESAPARSAPSRKTEQ